MNKQTSEAETSFDPFSQAFDDHFRGGGGRRHRRRRRRHRRHWCSRRLGGYKYKLFEIQMKTQNKKKRESFGG